MTETFTVHTRHANDVLLGGNKWLQVYTMPDFYGYTYTVSPYCNNQSVALLPYRIVNDKIEYLGRYEICPAHSDDYELCSITGGYEVGKFHSYLECAVGELHEEGGFQLTDYARGTYLGEVKPAKIAMHTDYLFAFDVTNMERVEAPSDGTEGEQGAWCDWITEEQILNCKDPLIITMLARFKDGLTYRRLLREGWIK